MHQGTIAAAVMLVLGMPGLAGLAGAHGPGPDGFDVQQNEYNEIGISTPTDGGPEEVGAFSDETVEGEVPAVSMALLPGGEVLYFSGAEADETKDGPTDLQFIWEARPTDARSRVLDLGTGDVETPTPEDGGHQDLFCSGITVTPDGTGLAAGATEWYTLDEDPPEAFYTPVRGGEQTLLFDPDAGDGPGGEWTRSDDMAEERWYPSTLQLPDGDTLVASGIQDLFYPNSYTTLLERFDPQQGAWDQVETSLELADGVAVDQQIAPETPDTGFAPADDTHEGPPNLPMYPRLHVLPGGPHEGDVLYTGNGDVWAPFGHHPDQPLFGTFQTLDADTGTWSLHTPSPFGIRNLGTTVPLMVDAEDPEPRYLSFGGTLQQTGQATNTAEIIDASSSPVTSTPTDSMEMPRWTNNGVLLPDGSAISVGGSTYDNVLVYSSPNAGPLNVERFVPDEDGTGGTWETGPAMDDVRAYHSTALLTPDARVMVGGHVPLPAFHDVQREHMNPQHTNSTFEFYEPPYLHHDDGVDRPEILTQKLAQHNEGLATTVNGEDALEASFGDELTFPVENLEGGLDSVTLMKPGAATHQFTADQMGVELTADVDDAGDGLSLVDAQTPAPEDATLVPGWYMLFVNEDVQDTEDPYPSEAAWVHLS